MPTIREVLADQNPWWRGDFEVAYRERALYDEIQPFLPQPQIIALTGLRRVGKTTLMLKTVQDAIREGLDPYRVLYFSFDEFRQADLRDVLQEYATLTNTDPAQGRHLVLFDEIQKLRGWADQLKALYDGFQKRVKFIISGSESLFIRRDTRETLAGRMFPFQLHPLSFREYLRFVDASFEPVELYEADLRRHLEAFLRTQGFPELVGVREKAVVRKYLHESIVEPVVFRDLPMLLGIRDVDVLRALANLLMEEPGQIIVLRDLAGQLGVSRQTLSQYLAYLEQAFLLRKLYNFSLSRRKSERKLKRYYPVVLSADLLFREDAASRARAFEWLVVNQLRAEYFWRDPYKHEVDVVLARDGPIPLEVKSGRVGLGGLRAFMREFGVTRGYVVTRKGEGRHELAEGHVDEVPAYKFLLKARELVGLSD